jgi:hypothetical protein
MKGRLEAQSASFASLFFTFFAGGEEEGMLSHAPMEARYPSAPGRLRSPGMGEQTRSEKKQRLEVSPCQPFAAWG